MLLRTSRRKGLTLLEVLVALGTFLLSLIGLVFLLNVAGNMALEAQQKSTALQMAQTKLAEVAAGAVALEAQNDQSFEEDPDYRWSMNVDEAGTGLFNVQVTVTRQRKDGTSPSVSLSQMVIDPSMVGSVFDVPATMEETETTTDSGTASTDSSQSSSSGSTTQPATQNTPNKNAGGNSSRGGMGKTGGSGRGGTSGMGGSSRGGTGGSSRGGTGGTSGGGGTGGSGSSGRGGTGGTSGGGGTGGGGGSGSGGSGRGGSGR